MPVGPAVWDNAWVCDCSGAKRESQSWEEVALVDVGELVLLDCIVCCLEGGKGFELNSSKSAKPAWFALVGDVVDVPFVVGLVTASCAEKPRADSGIVLVVLVDSAGESNDGSKSAVWGGFVPDGVCSS